VPRLQACVVIEQVAAEHRLFNDFNGTADRKIELAVSTPLIDGDFSKSIRVLVPESRARGRSLKVLARSNSTRHDQACAARRNDRCKQSRADRPASLSVGAS
jgi:hypothetical protein